MIELNKHQLAAAHETLDDGREMERKYNQLLDYVHFKIITEIVTITYIVSYLICMTVIIQ